MQGRMDMFEVRLHFPDLCLVTKLEFQSRVEQLAREQAALVNSSWSNSSNSSGSSPSQRGVEVPGGTWIAIVPALGTNDPPDDRSQYGVELQSKLPSYR